MLCLWLDAQQVQILQAVKLFEAMQRALEPFKAMRRQGVVPDVITYSALISACEKGTQPERALELFEAMQRQGVLELSEAMLRQDGGSPT
jgi:pentatricopeptide repeat protein